MRVAAILTAPLLALATQAAGGEEESADAGAPAPPPSTPTATAPRPAASGSAPGAPAPTPAPSAPPPASATLDTAATAPSPSNAIPLPPPPAPPCRHDRDCDWLASCVAGACRVRPIWQPDPRCRDDDCRDDGECTFVAGDCEVARPEDCLQTTLCRRHGRCAVLGDECVAASDAYCLRSELCSRKGLCYADHEDGVCREYEAADPIPAGYHVESRVRWGLVAAGGGIFGGFYLLPLAATLPTKDAPSELAVPLVGPLLLVAQLDRTELLAGLAIGVLVLDFFGQTAGLTLLSVGFAAQRDVLTADPPSLVVTLAPSPGGFVVLGSF